MKELVATANHGRMGHPAIMIVDSDEDLVNKVASLPGAIGVVDVYAINSSVSVVKLGGKLASRAGILAARQLTDVLRPVSRDTTQ